MTGETQAPAACVATRLATLLTALADLFATEGRAGGDLAAAALREAAEDVAPRRSKSARLALEDEIERALGVSDAHPAARAALAAQDASSWIFSGSDSGTIPDALSRRMATAELIGPDGLFLETRCRVGLFAQSADFAYPMRRHAAEESFAMLAGQAHWRMGDGPERRLGPGAFIHHPSDAPHASRSGSELFVAAWRWTGDIGRESYHILPDARVA